MGAGRNQDFGGCDQLADMALRVIGHVDQEAGNCSRKLFPADLAGLL
jgi:hypothetical protein